MKPLPYRIAGPGWWFIALLLGTVFSQWDITSFVGLVAASIANYDWIDNL